MLKRVPPLTSMLLAGLLILAPPEGNAKDVVVTAYQDTKPKFLLDDHGNASGVCPEILNAIEAQDPSIYFSKPINFMPIKRIYKSMKTGRVHVYCGSGRNHYREENFIFSKYPLYKVSTSMVVSKKLAGKFKTLEDIKSNKNLLFTTVNGSSSERLLNELNFPTTRHFIMTVEKGLSLVKVYPKEVFTYHSLGLKYSMKNTKRWGSLKLLDLTLRDYEHWLLYSNVLPENKRERIDKAILKLKKKGIIERIITKYQ